MLANYARWYTFLPPQWSTIPSPLTGTGEVFHDCCTCLTLLNGPNAHQIVNSPLFASCIIYLQNRLQHQFIGNIQ